MFSTEFPKYRGQPTRSSTNQKFFSVLVPAICLYQLLHLLERLFGERAYVVALLSRFLDLDPNEDAEDVLPVAPAVHGALDISDPVLRVPGVVVVFDLED